MKNIDLNYLKNLIENNLINSLFLNEDKSVYSNILDESATYSLEAGGKRIRPLLLLSVVDMFKGNISDALPFALALEWIHTYSLIHDDLPAMDNDDYRRGKESNHKHFGEDIAILTGDALLTAALEIMAKACSLDPIYEKAKAMEVISVGAGNMIRGQIADIKADSGITEEEYFYIIKNKTGALFKAAILAGTYLTCSEESTIKAMNRFADRLGMAFQIADDILDYDKEEIVNYARLFGLEKAKEQFNALVSDAKNILNEYKNNILVLNIISMIEDSINE